MIYEEDILLIYHKLVIDIIDKWITTFNAKQFWFRDKNVLERWCENAPRNPTDLRFLKTLNKVYKAIYKHNNDIIYSLIK